MIKLRYEIAKEKLEYKYARVLYSTKFGKGKSALSVKKRFDNLKKELYFCDIFKDIVFSDIIFISPENIKSLLNKIELRIIAQAKSKYKNIKEKKAFIKDLKEELKFIFKYEKKFQKPLSKFFEQNLQVRTCYFCNIHFVNEYKVDQEDSQNEFTLDHYIDKGKYPYFALSLYNLIPSCYTCNSKLKKTKKMRVEPPNSKNFDFENKVKFKLFLDENCKNLHVQDKEDIDILLKEQFSNKYDKYIEIFKLNERYKAHKYIVYEMIEKAELYPESRLKELENLTGIPFQQIKKDIFNLSDEKDLSKKPFAKLIKDISEELGLK